MNTESHKKLKWRVIYLKSYLNMKDKMVLKQIDKCFSNEKFKKLIKDLSQSIMNLKT